MMQAIIIAAIIVAVTFPPEWDPVILIKEMAMSHITPKQFAKKMAFSLLLCVALTVVVYALLQLEQ